MSQGSFEPQSVSSALLIAPKNGGILGGVTSYQV
jgi:hypothetical protein